MRLNSRFATVSSWMSKGKLFHISDVPCTHLWRGRRICPLACPVAFPVAQRAKNLTTMQETQEMWVRFLGQQDPVEEDMATHCSILA